MFERKKEEVVEAKNTETTRLDTEQLLAVVELVKWIARNPTCSYPTPPLGVIKTFSPLELLVKFGLTKEE